ncbi:hypothetical protein EDB87DRAFT_1636391 [Lactarius vividus]|nr:hypothetical protein EDB87DRAFT_1636391 [Lactarius vividus]
MRSLYLHVSALNEDEYALFTSSFTDLLAFDTPLTTDADFEKQKVSIREARAWLRGRYADLPVSDLDQILRFFAPNPGQDPVLTRGQFFAVLRLVLHVRNGAELDRNLVFKQVYLNSSPHEPTSPSRPVNDRPSRPFPAPPRRRQISTGSVFDAPTSDTNPFSPANQVHDHPQPPVHPDLRTGTVSSPTIVPVKPPQILPVPTTPPAHPHHASNPFVARAAAAAARSSNPSPERKLPPLPPRKTPPLLPPRSTTLLISTPLTAPPSKPPPPPPPAKVPHLTTALMQQSLQASKAAQEAKRLEAQREQERVLRVLKSSARSPSPPKRSGVGSTSSRSSVDGTGPSKPLLPPRPRVSPPASVASARSFEQVAGAKLVTRAALRRSPSPLRSRSGSRPRTPSPSRPTTDLPPPVHPNRKTTQADYASISAAGTGTSSPSSARFGRSKSVHHPSPPPVPQRRRPDSVQLLPSPSNNNGPSTPSTPPASNLSPKPSTAPPTSSPTFSRLSRHLSLSARDPMWGDMRGTLSSMRYKAEAGISRRGWVPGLDREERLIAERRESEGLRSTASSDDGLGVDAELPADEERRRGPLERDEMKWPAGDGWSPLA